MPRKNFNAVAKLPQLPGHKMWHATAVNSTGFPMAFKAACENIMAKNGVKGKRLKEITITITLEKGDSNVDSED